jgi:hypothetical protein
MLQYLIQIFEYGKTLYAMGAVLYIEAYIEDIKNIIE